MNNFSKKITQKLNTIPELPGIYKFLDSDGRVIYIGKSICLKKRIKSYFVNNPKWEKAKKMISYIDDIEYIVTDTHLEARLLECELIKKVKPLFNSQMKNDERYAYINVNEYNVHNPISIVYKRESNSFGPIRRKFSLYKIIDSLKNLYPIKKDHGKYVFEYRLFPLQMDKITFENNKHILIEIFTETNCLLLFIKEVENKMKEAASLYKFETASIYRDIIFSLNYLNSGISGYKNLFFRNILLTIPTENSFKLLFVSKGEIVLRENCPIVTDSYINEFITRSLSLSTKTRILANEKISIDYRDILYSEIKSLPSEMIRFLD